MLEHSSSVIMDMPHSPWSDVIDSWYVRMVKCVQADEGSSKNRKSNNKINKKLE